MTGTSDSLAPAGFFCACAGRHISADTAEMKSTLRGILLGPRSAGVGSLLLLVLQENLLHAAEPAVVVRGLRAHVLEHLWMRQDQELLFVHHLDDLVAHLLYGQCAINARGSAAALVHPGDDRLRAEARHAQALAAIRDGEPLGECNRAVLGHAVRRGFDDVEKPCC